MLACNIIHCLFSCAVINGNPVYRSIIALYNAVTILCPGYPCCSLGVLTIHTPVSLGFCSLPKDTGGQDQTTGLLLIKLTFYHELQLPQQLISTVQPVSLPSISLRGMQEVQSKVLLLIQSLFRFSVHESS